MKQSQHDIEGDRPHTGREFEETSGIDSADLAAAVARLEALFPPKFAHLLNQALQPNPLSARREHRGQMLSLLQRSLASHQKVRILYESSSNVGECKERIVHPYHLLSYVRSWHMIAYCERRCEVRIFKVDRIKQAELLAENYRIPPDFNLENYLGSGWGLMRGAAGPAEEVRLHFSPQAGRWVAEEFWHPSQRVEELEDGSILFRMRVGLTPELVRWLLYYGNQVRVE